MSGRVKLQPCAARDFDRLPPAVRKRVDAALEELHADPYPPDSRPLHGPLAGSYRLRVGDYRVGYRVTEGVAIVWMIGHRSKFYDQARRRQTR